MVRKVCQVGQVMKHSTSFTAASSKSHHHQQDLAHTNSSNRRSRPARRAHDVIFLGLALMATFLLFLSNEMSSRTIPGSDDFNLKSCSRHHPWKRQPPHPDHREAGFLATEGIVVAPTAFFPTSRKCRIAHRRCCSLSRTRSTS